jgi:hypothetical protein
VPTVDAAALLEAWEAGAAEPPVRRAVLLLESGSPERSGSEWASVPIGARDARLLRLKEAWFGPLLETAEVCPRCGERLETCFSTRDIDRSAHPAPTGGEPRRVTVGDVEADYRLPTSLDLWSAAAEPTGDPRASLLFRCIEAARRGGERLDPPALPPAVLGAVVDAMAASDPMADVQVELSCGPCGHTWSAGFDIAAYLWSELDEWAERLLAEVHVLASAYGWRERDILALSATRRRAYLDLLGA